MKIPFTFLQMMFSLIMTPSISTRRHAYHSLLISFLRIVHIVYEDQLHVHARSDMLTSRSCFSKILPFYWTVIFILLLVLGFSYFVSFVQKNHKREHVFEKCVITSDSMILVEQILSVDRYSPSPRHLLCATLQCFYNLLCLLWEMLVARGSTVVQIVNNFVSHVQ